MDKKIYKFFDIEIKSTDEEKREIVAVGSKQVSDRDGDIVKIDGIDLKNYKKNPVVLWSHRHDDLPIGKATKVWKEDNKLMFKIQYAKPEEYGFADTVYKLTKGGYINAFSIGFAPDWDKAEKNEKSKYGYVFNKSELFEISAVPVPANPMALVQSKSIKKAVEDKVIDDLELKEIELYLKKIADEIEDQEFIDEVEDKIDEIDKSLDDDLINENPEQTINEDQTVEKTDFDYIWEMLTDHELKQKEESDLQHIYDLLDL
jgi:HK97 family phage prohead protease